MVWWNIYVSVCDAFPVLYTVFICTSTPTILSRFVFGAEPSSVIYVKRFVVGVKPIDAPRSEMTVEFVIDIDAGEIAEFLLHAGLQVLGGIAGGVVVADLTGVIGHHAADQSAGGR